MSFGSGAQPPNMKLSCEDLRDLLGAFVLDSLEATEEERVREHLEGCLNCRAAAEELRSVAMQIGDEVAELDPPPGLRARVLAQARAETQGRPLPVLAGKSDSLAERPRTRRWSPWLATAAAALLALSAGGWGLYEHLSGPSAGVGLTSVRLSPVDKLIADGDATVITLSPSAKSAAHGALVTDPSTGATYLLLSSVPALHSRKVYALWYVATENGSPTPVRIGQVKRQGAYRINRGPSGFTELALTREPKPGDSSPRGPVLLEAALS
ncbi:MAG: anti-sigma factor [Candidatus Dormiibacterota bacterium]